MQIWKYIHNKDSQQNDENKSNTQNEEEKDSSKTPDQEGDQGDSTDTRDDQDEKSNESKTKSDNQKSDSKSDEENEAQESSDDASASEEEEENDLDNPENESNSSEEQDEIKENTPTDLSEESENKDESFDEENPSSSESQDEDEFSDEFNEPENEQVEDYEETKTDFDDESKNDDDLSDDKKENLESTSDEETLDQGENENSSDEEFDNFPEEESKLDQGEVPNDEEDLEPLDQGDSPNVEELEEDSKPSNEQSDETEGLEEEEKETQDSLDNEDKQGEFSNDSEILPGDPNGNEFNTDNTLEHLDVEFDYSLDELEEAETEEELNDTEKKLELLKQFKSIIEQVAEQEQKREIESRKAELGERGEISEELEDEPTKENAFLGKLRNLPPFDQRQTSDGYAIDTETVVDVDELVIKTLLNKFLRQQFCNRATDLNRRSNSLEKSSGLLRWEIRDLIIHLETEQIPKIPNDKYGYDYAQGKSEAIPLSFYFDLSGSMSSFTALLAQMAIELLKRDVKVLIGYNSTIMIQIDAIDKNMDVKKLTELITTYSTDSPKVKCKSIGQFLDKYLIDKKAERVAVFADFDPRESVITLSNYAKVYWFCFESQYKIDNLEGFRGFAYPVKDLDTIAEALIKVSASRFEALVYLENPEERKRIREKKG